MPDNAQVLFHIFHVFLQGQKVSFSTPLNTHGNSKLTPAISSPSLPPPSSSSQGGPSSETADAAVVGGSGTRQKDGMKEQPLSVGESVGDSSRGSETRELYSSSSQHLQQVLEKQLNQQKQAAITGLGMHTVLCRSLDGLPDHSNWGLTNQRREGLQHQTNTLLSLVNSKLNIGGHCQVTCKAR